MAMNAERDKAVRSRSKKKWRYMYVARPPGLKTIPEDETVAFNTCSDGPAVGYEDPFYPLGMIPRGPFAAGEVKWTAEYQVCHLPLQCRFGVSDFFVVRQYAAALDRRGVGHVCYGDEYLVQRHVRSGKTMAVALGAADLGPALATLAPMPRYVVGQTKALSWKTKRRTNAKSAKKMKKMHKKSGSGMSRATGARKARLVFVCMRGRHASGPHSDNASGIRSLIGDDDASFPPTLGLVGQSSYAACRPYGFGRLREGTARRWASAVRRQSGSSASVPLAPVPNQGVAARYDDAYQRARAYMFATPADICEAHVELYFECLPMNARRRRAVRGCGRYALGRPCDRPDCGAWAYSDSDSDSDSASDLEYPWDD